MKTHYKIEIRWSDDDNVYLAHVPELGFTTHGKTQAHAAEMAQEAIELHLETLADIGIEAPVPVADRDFSGQLPLRIGKFRHEDLYIKAQQSGLSMNEYLVQLIDRDIQRDDDEYVVRKQKPLSVEAPRKRQAKGGATKKLARKR